MLVVTIRLRWRLLKLSLAELAATRDELARSTTAQGVRPPRPGCSIA
jgi:hypothetical protein